MIFNKNMSYNINPLSMPRLYDSYNISDVLVRKLDEHTGVIRFSNILDYARNNNIGIYEAGNTICREHGLENYISIVNELKMYTNPSYKQAVLENYKIIPMQLESIGYDEELCNLLEYNIDIDIYNDTYNTDIILNELHSLAGWNQANNTISTGFYNTVDSIRAIPDKVAGAIAGKIKSAVGNKIVSSVDSALSDPAKQDKLADSLRNVGSKLAGGAVKGAFDDTKTSVAPYLKGAAATAAIGGGLYVLNNQINNLTNNEAIKTKNPGIIARIINALKRCFNSLLGRQKVAPSNQQGIIARLINKVKNAIRYFGRKVGLISNETRYK